MSAGVTVSQEKEEMSSKLIEATESPRNEDTVVVVKLEGLIFDWVCGLQEHGYSRQEDKVVPEHPNVMLAQGGNGAAGSNAGNEPCEQALTAVGLQSWASTIIC